MAFTFSLAQGGNTVTLSDLALGTPPNLNTDTGRITHTALDGSIYIYDRYTAKVAHDRQVNDVSSADAGYINAWRENGTTVVYTPDTDVAGTTYNVKIINTDPPLKLMQIATKYEGTIMIRQI